MNAKWILLPISAVLAVGCHTPKEDTYTFKIPEYKPPVIDTTFNDDLQKRLKELLNDSKCQEAEQTPIELKGALVNMGPGVEALDFRITAPEEAKIDFTGPAEPTFKTPVGVTRQLLNSGCSDEMVKAHTEEGMEVKQYENGKGTIAEKILLCGPIKAGALSVFAKTVVMKDFEYVSSALGFVSIKTGELILEGKSKVTAMNVSSSIIALNTLKVELIVENRVEGKGSLKLESKTVTCEEVAKKAEEKKKEEEKKAEKKPNE